MFFILDNRCSRRGHYFVTALVDCKKLVDWYSVQVHLCFQCGLVSKLTLFVEIKKFLEEFLLTNCRSFLFPQCQRYLTMEEYRQQGEEETRKALEKLRLYCRSPEADVWKITSSVSDPRR